MKLKRGASLSRVAVAVATVLRASGVRAVLTGGACAGLHTRGLYTSSDLDFVLLGGAVGPECETAMAGLGFQRRGNTYRHPEMEFVVEFLPEPIAIGADTSIRPITLRLPGGYLTALSATDSCRDRLAAWYHWRDAQSLGVAVLIAVTRRVDLKKIEAWSRAEGHVAGWERFMADLAERRRVYRK